MGTDFKEEIKENNIHMKKRILAVILCTILCFGVTGCSADHLIDGEDNFSSIDNEYMKMHILYDERDGCIIAYDEYTKVMYLCAYGNSTMAITPIYNSDGTVKLYDGTEVDTEAEDETGSTLGPVNNMLNNMCSETMEMFKEGE